ncbi:reverse transcriptase domain-containing protein [Tanacetum coccineum]
MNGGCFSWTDEVTKAFELLKVKVTSVHVLSLPNFNDVFRVECDASGVGIGGVLSQNKRLISFFSEKLNEARRKFSTNDKEFYAIIHSLDTWMQYLLANKFVLFSDREALKHINGQHKLKPEHAKWVEFLQALSFAIVHKVRSQNQVADARSRRHSLVTDMKVSVKDMDANDQSKKIEDLLQEVCDNIVRSNTRYSAQANLSPYSRESEDEEDSWTSLSQERENDIGEANIQN